MGTGGFSRNYVNGASSLMLWSTFWVMLLTPVAIPLGHAARGKPIDVVLSDLVVAAILLATIPYIVLKRVPRKHFIYATSALGVAAFFVGLALVGATRTSSTLPVISAVKYAKPMVAFAAGVAISRVVGLGVFWRAAAVGSVLIIMAIAGSQVLIVQSFSPRWGATLFGLPIYGFPNSSATFVVMPIMFSLSRWAIGGSIVFLTSSIVGIVLMIMSLSRSAAVVALVFILLAAVFQLSLANRLSLGVSAAASVGLMVLILVSTGSLERTSVAMMSRVEPFLAGYDPTSGRLTIAREALGLIEERLLIGYQFESFSNYNLGHDTLHNQYIEGLFKTGILGFIVYWGFVGYMLSTCIGRIARVRKESIIYSRYATFYILAVIALLIGNMTQPNFTYSLTGNVVFMLLGYIGVCDVPASYVKVRG